MLTFSHVSIGVFFVALAVLCFAEEVEGLPEEEGSKAHGNQEIPLFFDISVNKWVKYVLHWSLVDNNTAVHNNTFQLIYFLISIVDNINTAVYI